MPLNTTDLNLDCDRYSLLQTVNDIDSQLGESEQETPRIMQTSPYYPVDESVALLNSRKDIFKIIALNCQSLRAKFSQLECFIKNYNDNDCDIDAMCLQETWIKDSANTQQFNIDGYNVIFKSPVVSKHGGLAIYLNKKYTFEILNISDNPQIWEGLFVKVEIKNADTGTTSFLILGNIYRPPRDLVENYKSFVDDINKILHDFNMKNINVIISGDFNIDLLMVKEKNIVQIYFETLISNGFIPKITYPTRLCNNHGTLIDNFLCKLNGNFSNTTAGIIAAKISDHLPYFITLDFIKHIKTKTKYVSFRKFDQEAYQSFKNSINQENILSVINTESNANPNNNYDTVHDIITKSFESHFPLKTVKLNKHKHKKSSWITKGIIKSIAYRDNLYLSLKKTPINSREHNKIQTNLKSYNNILKTTIRRAKQIYFESKFYEFRYDMKNTWKTIKDVICKKPKKSISTKSFLIANKEVKDPKEIANAFNTFYLNIGPYMARQANTNVNFSEYLKTPCTTEFIFKEVEAHHILKIIDNLKAKTSYGFDGLSTKLLKHIKDEISAPIATIINQSFKSGIFPEKLKIAKVLPIYKKNDKSIIENYRPISLLPGISKIIEKIIVQQLTDHFIQNNLFYKGQYGFRSNHSTEYAALDVINKIYKTLDNNNCSLNIFLDLSKAFDSLDHTILLKKLNYYGIKGKSLELFESYLTNRKQFVLFENNKSCLGNITTGVPQGSVLGPVLFLIYINDIINADSIFDLTLYADDTTLTTTLQANNYKNINKDGENFLNSEIHKIHTWLLANRLSLNINKTKAIIFQTIGKKIVYPKLQIDNKVIEYVDTFSFLGICIHKNLNWKIHTDYVASKIAKTAGIMNQLKRFLPENILLMIYNTLVTPHLSYGVLLWGYRAERLVKLQKRLIRIIKNKKYNAHTEPLLKELKLLKVQDIFRHMQLKFLFKLENDLVPINIQNLFHKTERNRYNTRNQTRYTIPRVKHAFAEQCLHVSIPMLVRDTQSLIIEKVHTHSFKGFSNYVKQNFLNTYETECFVQNCYVCNH